MQQFQLKHLTRDVDWNEDCFDHQCGEMMRNRVRINKIEERLETNG